MNNCFHTLTRLMVFLLMYYALAGCADSESNPANEYLIRVADRVMTVVDFNKAFEIAKTAYPHNLRHEPEYLQKAKLRLLNQLTVEMILLERAEEIGLKLSEAEVENAVAEIKSDYPEGVFEQTLLEFAVTFETWEDRLKTRLLMEKVVDTELKDKIVITSEDIAEYYKKNYTMQGSNSDLAAKDKDFNEMIIKHLRREKAETAYKAWIKKLKEHYTIEINSAQWEKLTGSRGITEENLEAAE